MFLILGHMLRISLQNVAYPIGSRISIISFPLPKCCVLYGFCVSFDMLFVIFLYQVDIQLHCPSLLLVALSNALPDHFYLILFARLSTLRWGKAEGMT